MRKTQGCGFDGKSALGVPMLSTRRGVASVTQFDSVGGVIPNARVLPTGGGISLEVQSGGDPSLHLKNGSAWDDPNVYFEIASYVSG